MAAAKVINFLLIPILQRLLKYLLTNDIPVTVCKKDLKRTDYRKADKMRPGIWYLILAIAYLIVSCWSLYFVCTMYIAVKKTVCESATFVDVINMGYEEDANWVGVQRLGK